MTLFGVLSLAARVATPDPLVTLVGESPAMAALRATLRKVAPHKATVLVRGESGTGKEVVARALHALSPRAGAPFVAVNCGAIPAGLIESELFGHTKGAFTDAVRDRAGLVEQAAGGTLFLDEVAELPPASQVKLLRVLQDGHVRRLGADADVIIDVRVVAATSRPLEAEVAAGRFREDLLFRLDVLTVRLPPLREREGDVVLLARHYLTKYGEQFRGRALSLGKDAEPLLLAHPWPGNVRELQNVIQRALLKLPGTRLGAKELAALLPTGAVSDRGLTGLVDQLLDAPPPEGGRHAAAVAAVEAPLIAAAMARTKGNQLRAAELLGMNRNTLRERMRALGMKAR